MINEGIDPYKQASFSLKNRIGRAVWGGVYIFLFKPSPRPFHGYRSLILKIFGAKLGKHCHVYPRARIWAPWNLEMADYSGMADDVICYNMAKIYLGERVVVSQGTHLCAGSHDYEASNFQLYAKPILVGNQAWLCAECFIGPGVEIGVGAVIGARSVVTKNMPAWMVCAGNPCKPLKPRVIKN